MANSAVLRWADVSPETIKYIGKYLTGGSGTFLANTYSTGKDAITGEPFDIERAPVLRKMVKIQDSDEKLNRFYSQLEHVKEIAGENEIKQTKVLGGTSAVYWQKKMKNLRDKEFSSIEKSQHNQAALYRKEQENLSDKFSRKYNERVIPRYGY